MNFASVQKEKKISSDMMKQSPAIRKSKAQKAQDMRVLQLKNVLKKMEEDSGQGTNLDDMAAYISAEKPGEVKVAT